MKPTLVKHKSGRMHTLSVDQQKVMVQDPALWASAMESSGYVAVLDEEAQLVPLKDFAWAVAKKNPMTKTVEDKQIGEWTLRFIRGARYSGRELIALLIHADGKHVGSQQVLALAWRLGSEMIGRGYAPRLTDCGMVVLMGGGKVAAGVEFEAGDAKLEAEIEAVVREQLA